MAQSYKERLRAITTVLVDVDGVLTDGTVLIDGSGELLRKLSSRDAYALQYALRKGMRIGVITGSNSTQVRDALQRLGVGDIFLESKNKLVVYGKFIADNDLQDEEICYMGDDIPDYEVMQRVGISACPYDAADEIRGISHYVSPKRGGEGCVRDVIEQIMKVQGTWFAKDAVDW
jgi:3-deoxy-D-manno-octulosonate 8-phosphate phosphatase (KDO 8-P phosphatase)